MNLDKTYYLHGEVNVISYPALDVKGNFDALALIKEIEEKLNQSIDLLVEVNNIILKSNEWSLLGAALQVGSNTLSALNPLTYFGSAPVTTEKPETSPPNSSENECLTDLEEKEDDDWLVLTSPPKQ